MKNLILKTLAIYFVGHFFAACTSCGWGGDDGPSKYNILNYNGFSVAKTQSASGSYFSQSSPHLEDGNTVAWNEFAIFIETEKEYIGMLRGVSLFANAFACDPAPPRAVQKIASFTITSENEFASGSQSFAPGESLNELFDVEDREDRTIENFLVDQRHPEIIFLTLKTAPSNNQVHRFHIDINLDNGSKYGLSTILVNLAI